VGVLFYLKPDGQYILADDDGMAVTSTVYPSGAQYNKKHKQPL
jgi:hypothetical protein